MMKWYLLFLVVILYLTASLFPRRSKKKREAESKNQKITTITEFRELLETLIKRVDEVSALVFDINVDEAEPLLDEFFLDYQRLSLYIYHSIECGEEMINLDREIKANLGAVRIRWERGAYSNAVEVLKTGVQDLLQELQDTLNIVV